MSHATAPRWHAMRDARSRRIENVLRSADFLGTDAYRYNSASIRVRVIDDRFIGLAPEQRDALVESHLRQLPQDIQEDIMNLLTITQDEAEHMSRYWLRNREFEDPSPSSIL